MGIPRIFKLPSNRQFNYQPLYYDAAKEERESRNRALQEELGMKPEDKDKYIPGIKRGSMRYYFKDPKRAGKNTNIRLIIILAVLFFIAYLLLYR